MPSFFRRIIGLKYHFGELLLDSTLEKHALEPFMYGGNTNSSSFEHVVLSGAVLNETPEYSAFQIIQKIILTTF